MDRWRISWFGERKTTFVFLAAFRGFALVVATALLLPLTTGVVLISACAAPSVPSTPAETPSPTIPIP